MILTPESKAALARAVEELTDLPPIVLDTTPISIHHFTWTGLTLVQYGDPYPAWIEFTHKPHLLTCIAILHDFDGTAIESAVSSNPTTCFKLLQRKVRARKMSLRKES